ncbi:MAG TPA: hypothetical protein VNB64_12220 [Solirubrobacteraceae bacterium]|nr:hypothetical protein [Solirubrobacteraceae bacterium]
MARDQRIFDLDELLVRPGAYFNPQTEVLVIVDDSPELDQEIFNMEEFEGAEWVLVADDLPVDEPRRDELLERFQVRYHPGGAASITDYDDDDADDEDSDDQEVGREGLGHEEEEETL